MLYNGRNNDAISFIEDYGSIILEAKRKASEKLEEEGGTRLRILTPNKCFKDHQ